MDGLGELLRGKREELGMSIKDVSSELLIPINKLMAIENNAFSNFEDDQLYLYLYVKKYARFLGLNEAECKEKLDIFFSEGQDKEERNRDNGADGRKIVPEYRKNKVYKDNNASSYLKVVLSLVLIVLSIFAVYKGISFFGDDGSFEPNTPKEVDPPIIGNNDNDNDNDHDNDNQQQPAKPEIDIIRDEEFVYTIIADEDLVFRIVFNNERTWISLDVNGEIVESAPSRTYNQGEIADASVMLGSTINLRVGMTRENQYFVYSGSNEPIEIILEENERNHSGGKNYVFKFVKREN